VGADFWRSEVGLSRVEFLRFVETQHVERNTSGDISPENISMKKI